MQQRNDNNRYNNYQQESASRELCNIIKGKPLSSVLTAEKIFLPQSGYAFKIAQEIHGDIDTTQLRKIFDMIKKVESIEDFDTKRNNLYMVVPQVAYSCGRKICPEKFYNIIAACITKETLKDDNDVKTFIDLIESIVAYKKFNQVNRGGK